MVLQSPYYFIQPCTSPQLHTLKKASYKARRGENVSRLRVLYDRFWKSGVVGLIWSHTGERIWVLVLDTEANIQLEEELKEDFYDEIEVWLKNK